MMGGSSETMDIRNLDRLPPSMKMPTRSLRKARKSLDPA
jgi:hypothetical protein